jgi:hypothetical protein
MNKIMQNEKDSKEEIERLRKELEHLRGKSGDKNSGISQHPLFDIFAKVQESVNKRKPFHDLETYFYDSKSLFLFLSGSWRGFQQEIVGSSIS